MNKKINLNKNKQYNNMEKLISNKKVKSQKGYVYFIIFNDLQKIYVGETITFNRIEKYNNCIKSYKKYNELTNKGVGTGISKDVLEAIIESVDAKEEYKEMYNRNILSEGGGIYLTEGM